MLEETDTPPDFDPEVRYITLSNGFCLTESDPAFNAVKQAICRGLKSSLPIAHTTLIKSVDMTGLSVNQKRFLRKIGAEEIAWADPHMFATPFEYYVSKQKLCLGPLARIGITNTIDYQIHLERLKTFFGTTDLPLSFEVRQLGPFKKYLADVKAVCIHFFRTDADTYQLVPPSTIEMAELFADLTAEQVEKQNVQQQMEVSGKASIINPGVWFRKHPAWIHVNTALRIIAGLYAGYHSILGLLAIIWMPFAPTLTLAMWSFVEGLCCFGIASLTLLAASTKKVNAILKYLRKGFAMFRRFAWYNRVKQWCDEHPTLSLFIQGLVVGTIIGSISLVISMLREKIRERFKKNSDAVKQANPNPVEIWSWFSVSVAGITGFALGLPFLSTVAHMSSIRRVSTWVQQLFGIAGKQVDDRHRHFVDKGIAALNETAVLLSIPLLDTKKEQILSYLSFKNAQAINVETAALKELDEIVDKQRKDMDKEKTKYSPVFRPLRTLERISTKGKEDDEVEPLAGVPVTKKEPVVTYPTRRIHFGSKQYLFLLTANADDVRHLSGLGYDISATDLLHDQSTLHAKMAEIYDIFFKDVAALHVEVLKSEQEIREAETIPNKNNFASSMRSKMALFVAAVLVIASIGLGIWYYYRSKYIKKRWCTKEFVGEKCDGKCGKTHFHVPAHLKNRIPVDLQKSGFDLAFKDGKGSAKALKVWLSGCPVQRHDEGKNRHGGKGKKGGRKGRAPHSHGVEYEELLEEYYDYLEEKKREQEEYELEFQRQLDMDHRDDFGGLRGDDDFFKTTSKRWADLPAHVTIKGFKNWVHDEKPRDVYSKYFERDESYIPKPPPAPPVKPLPVQAKPSQVKDAVKFKNEAIMKETEHLVEHVKDILTITLTDGSNSCESHGFRHGNTILMADHGSQVNGKRTDAVVTHYSPVAGSKPLVVRYSKDLISHYPGIDVAVIPMVAPKKLKFTTEEISAMETVKEKIPTHPLFKLANWEKHVQVGTHICMHVMAKDEKGRMVPTVVPGRVLSIQKDSYRFMHDISTKPGYSGAPIYLSGGKVKQAIGMHLGTLADVNRAAVMVSELIDRVLVKKKDIMVGGAIVGQCSTMNTTIKPAANPLPDLKWIQYEGRLPGRVTSGHPMTKDPFLDLPDVADFYPAVGGEMRLLKALARYDKPQVGFEGTGDVYPVTSRRVVKLKFAFESLYSMIELLGPYMQMYSPISWEELLQRTPTGTSAGFYHPNYSSKSEVLKHELMHFKDSFNQLLQQGMYYPVAPIAKAQGKLDELLQLEKLLDHKVRLILSLDTWTYTVDGMVYTHQNDGLAHFPDCLLGKPLQYGGYHDVMQSLQNKLPEGWKWYCYDIKQNQESFSDINRMLVAELRKKVLPSQLHNAHEWVYYHKNHAGVRVVLGGDVFLFPPGKLLSGERNTLHDNTLNHFLMFGYAYHSSLQSFLGDVELPKIPVSFFGDDGMIGLPSDEAFGAYANACYEYGFNLTLETSPTEKILNTRFLGSTPFVHEGMMIPAYNLEKLRQALRYSKTDIKTPLFSYQKIMGLIRLSLPFPEFYDECYSCAQQLLRKYPDVAKLGGPIPTRHDISRLWLGFEGDLKELMPQSRLTNSFEMASKKIVKKVEKKAAALVMKRVAKRQPKQKTKAVGPPVSAVKPARQNKIKLRTGKSKKSIDFTHTVNPEAFEYIAPVPVPEGGAKAGDILLNIRLTPSSPDLDPSSVLRTFGGLFQMYKQGPRKDGPFANIEFRTNCSSLNLGLVGIAPIWSPTQVENFKAMTPLERLRAIATVSGFKSNAVWKNFNCPGWWPAEFTSLFCQDGEADNADAATGSSELAGACNYIVIAMTDIPDMAGGTPLTQIGTIYNKLNVTFMKMFIDPSLSDDSVTVRGTGSIVPTGDGIFAYDVYAGVTGDDLNTLKAVVESTTKISRKRVRAKGAVLDGFLDVLATVLPGGTILKSAVDIAGRLLPAIFNNSTTNKVMSIGTESSAAFNKPASALAPSDWSANLFDVATKPWQAGVRVPYEEPDGYKQERGTIYGTPGVVFAASSPKPIANSTTIVGGPNIVGSYAFPALAGSAAARKYCQVSDTTTLRDGWGTTASVPMQTVIIPPGGAMFPTPYTEPPDYAPNTLWNRTVLKDATSSYYDTTWIDDDTTAIGNFAVTLKDEKKDSPEFRVRAKAVHPKRHIMIVSDEVAEKWFKYPLLEHPYLSRMTLKTAVVYCNKSHPVNPRVKPVITFAPKGLDGYEFAAARCLVEKFGDRILEKLHLREGFLDTFVGLSDLEKPEKVMKVYFE